MPIKVASILRTKTITQRLSGCCLCEICILPCRCLPTKDDTSILVAARDAHLTQAHSVDTTTHVWMCVCMCMWGCLCGCGFYYTHASKYFKLNKWKTLNTPTAWWAKGRRCKQYAREMLKRNRNAKKAVDGLLKIIVNATLAKSMCSRTYTLINVWRT